MKATIQVNKSLMPGLFNDKPIKLVQALEKLLGDDNVDVSPFTIIVKGAFNPAEVHSLICSYGYIIKNSYIEN